MRPAIPLLLMLAACDGPAAPSVVAPSPTPVGRSAVQTRILDLPPRQRDGVFLRAIRDGGAKCQGVASALRQEDQQGQIAWTAVCTDGPAYLVSIDRNGVAQVTAVSADRR